MQVLMMQLETGKDILASCISMMQSTLFRLALICLRPVNTSLLQWWGKQYILQYIFERIYQLQSILSALTFSHVSRKPMSHFTSSKVESSSKVTNIIKCLEQLHV